MIEKIADLGFRIIMTLLVLEWLLEHLAGPIGLSNDPAGRWRLTHLLIDGGSFASISYCIWKVRL